MGYFVGVRCLHCGYSDDFAYGRGAHDRILSGERLPWYCPSCVRTFGLKWGDSWRGGQRQAPSCPVCHGVLSPYKEALSIQDEYGDEGEGESVRLNRCPRCGERQLEARFTGFWD